MYTVLVELLIWGNESIRVNYSPLSSDLSPGRTHDRHLVILGRSIRILIKNRNGAVKHAPQL